MDPKNVFLGWIAGSMCFEPSRRKKFNPDPDFQSSDPGQQNDSKVSQEQEQEQEASSEMSC